MNYLHQAFVDDSQEETSTMHCGKYRSTAPNDSRKNDRKKI